LKIPTNKKSQEMKPTEGALGEKLRKNCQGLKVLLVDERSLIGATTLGWVEFSWVGKTNKPFSDNLERKSVPYFSLKLFH
jgi:hypothetical protein